MSSIELVNLSILLVEPSSTQSRVIQSMLNEAGVEGIDTVTSGQDAILFAEKYPPDLVISAMYLPDMSAIELLAKLRETEIGHATNFMLVSSETSFSALEPIRQAGVVAILPKPFDSKDLQRALITTLDYVSPDEIELSNYDVSELNVLVVDDSQMARNHIVRVLANLGVVQISTAANGLEAIDRLMADRFDFIITDLNMREMDGQQLIEYVRTELEDSLIPIMMVTSEHDEARLGNVQQAGVSAICDKPFEPQFVKEILSSVLDDR
jgi:two-component system chemotaxis response regulator CheY